MAPMFTPARALLMLWLSMFATGQNLTTPEFNARRTISIGILVFPGFEPLDIFGPLEILYSLSYAQKMTLAIIAEKTAGPVSARVPPHLMGPDMPPMDIGYMIAPTIHATHGAPEAPSLDVLLVPGGMGIEILEQQGNTWVEDFINRRYDRLDYLLSVCTGAIGLARSGRLDGRRATSNKKAWASAARWDKVDWVPTARWVRDGNIWTSSGVAAGMDMTYAFLRHLYGEDDVALTDVMNTIEYAPHTDPNWDPFSIVHKVPGANGTLESCVKPVGS